MDEYLYKLRQQLPDASEEDDLLLISLIETSIGIYRNQRFPFNHDEESMYVEPKYKYWIIKCAKELYSRMGAEGEVQHSEAGITRTYRSEDISKMLLHEVIPFCGTI